MEMLTEEKIRAAVTNISNAVASMCSKIGQAAETIAKDRYKLVAMHALVVTGKLPATAKSLVDEIKT